MSSPISPVRSPEPPPLPSPGPDVVPVSADRRLGWLLRPVRLQSCRGARQFIFRILVQQFAVKVAVAVPVGFLIPDNAPQAHADLLGNPLLALIVLCLVAPPFETLLLQAAPIEILRALRRSRRLQFLFGAAPFAALHFLQGTASGIGAGIVGGAFFSYTYLECRSRSWWTSLWVTTATHSLHNLVVLPLAFAMVK